MLPDIQIDHDKVTIEGVVISRPQRMSPSQWLDAWNIDGDKDTVASLEKENNDLKDQLETAKSELALKEDEVTALQNRLDDIKGLAGY